MEPKESLNPNRLWELANDQLNRGNYHGAITTLELILSTDPNDVPTRHRLAKAYTHLGRTDSAEREWRALEDCCRSGLSIFNGYIAEGLYQRGDFDRAIRFFNLAISGNYGEVITPDLIHEHIDRAYWGIIASYCAKGNPIAALWTCAKSMIFTIKTGIEPNWGITQKAFHQ